jgi:hypothetical protein
LQTFPELVSELCNRIIDISFTGHIDVMVGRALAMLGFVKRLSCEFRDPYTLKTLKTLY